MKTNFLWPLGDSQTSNVRLSVRMFVRTDFGLGATDTRQIWWFCIELNYKTSDRGIFSPSP